MEKLRSARGEHRSVQRLQAHFEIEQRLAARLASSSRDQRLVLYGTVYGELFESVPDHPQRNVSDDIRSRRLKQQTEFLISLLDGESTYVEIGCGDAALTKLVASHVRCAIGVDVTPVLVIGNSPSAFHFLRSDGVNIDLPAGTADLVFSNQLMEHLHADDAGAQLQEIVRILKPGGLYMCCTPNRLTGPHDISMYFGYEPTGFHLREYDHRSLAAAFRSAGFGRVRARVSAKGRTAMLPVALFSFAEAALERLPTRVRRSLLRQSALRNLLGVTMVGEK